MPMPTAFTKVSGGACPNGWEFLPISQKCVKVIAEKAPLFNHMVNCTRLGGNLVSIISESSNSEIASFAHKLNVPTAGYIIGLVQLNPVWQWTDGSSLVYANWFGDHASEQGAILVTQDTFDYSNWEQIPSNDDTWPALCETPPGS